MRSDNMLLEEHEDSASAFFNFITRANFEYRTREDNPGIFHEIFSPTYRGSRVRDFKNPCNCNNTICILAYNMDEDEFRDQPATAIGSSSMDVLLGPLGYVLGDNEDPQHGPISLYDLISNIHSKLHSPLDIIEIDTSKFPVDCVGLTAVGSTRRSTLSIGTLREMQTTS